MIFVLHIRSSFFPKKVNNNNLFDKFNVLFPVFTCFLLLITKKRYPVLFLLNMVILTYNLVSKVVSNNWSQFEIDRTKC